MLAKPLRTWRGTTIAHKRKLKKRSGASSAKLHPEDVTFFIDRSLGREKVPNALRQAGAKVVVHDDIFANDAPDEEWLAAAGKSKWVVWGDDGYPADRPL